MTGLNGPSLTDLFPGVAPSMLAEDQTYAPVIVSSAAGMDDSKLAQLTSHGMKDVTVSKGDIPSGDLAMGYAPISALEKIRALGFSVVRDAKVCP